MPLVIKNFCGARWRSRLVKAVLRLGRLLRFTMDIASARRKFDRLAGSIFFRQGCPHDSISASGIPADWVYGGAHSENGVLFYLHGGAFISGSPITHRPLVCRIARETGTRALVVAYRLAPEHPYPAALEDVHRAFAWLLQQGIAPGSVAVAGDSAGGGLALRLLQDLRDAREALPACVVCLSPWVDLSCSGASMQDMARRDPFLVADRARLRARMYAGSRALEDPAVSPLFGDLSGLPPLLIQVGSEEILLDDARRLAEKADCAGIEVEIQIWENMIHVWQYLAGFLPEGRRAIAEIGGFLNRHTASSQESLANIPGNA